MQNDTFCMFGTAGHFFCSVGEAGTVDFWGVIFSVSVFVMAEDWNLWQLTFTFPPLHN